MQIHIVAHIAAIYKTHGLIAIACLKGLQHHIYSHTYLPEPAIQNFKGKFYIIGKTFMF